MTSSVNEAIEKRLSGNLLPIFKIELELGNSVARIDCPAGTKCPYAVVMRNKINHKEIDSRLELTNEVKKWESRDQHYDLESGYACEKTKHAIAGPL